jgi:hypothetical protein
VSPTTRPDRRRAGRAAARKTEKRGPAPARKPAQTRKPASPPRTAQSRRGSGFLNTLIIALLVVLVVMIVAVFIVLYHYVL